MRMRNHRRILWAGFVHSAEAKPYIEQVRRRLFALRQLRVPMRTRIQFANNKSRSRTFIDIESGDRAGLRYHASQALTGLRCDIAMARIVMDARQVLDSFHVFCEGRKAPSSEEMERVWMRLHQAMHRPSAVETKGATL